MAEVIHEHEHTSSEGSGMGFYLGLIILILAFLLIIFYGLPYLTRVGRSTSPQINVPGKIDVNVNKGTQ